MINPKNLILLISAGCPYCDKVLRFCKQSDITLPVVDIMDDEAARDKLYQLTKRLQVPCLLIDESPMLESEDIIRYLKSEFTV